MGSKSGHLELQRPHELQGLLQTFVSGSQTFFRLHFVRWAHLFADSLNVLCGCIVRLRLISLEMAEGVFPVSLAMDLIGSESSRLFSITIRSSSVRCLPFPVIFSDINILFLPHMGGGGYDIPDE